MEKKVTISKGLYLGSMLGAIIVPFVLVVVGASITAEQSRPGCRLSGRRASCVPRVTLDAHPQVPSVPLESLVGCASTGFYAPENRRIVLSNNFQSNF